MNVSMVLSKGVFLCFSVNRIQRSSSMDKGIHPTEEVHVHVPVFALYWKCRSFVLQFLKKDGSEL